MVEFKDGLALQAGDVSTYVFDVSTGEYLGAGSAYVCAGFGLPAGATLEAPPGAPDGQAAVWQDDAWVLMVDNRGTAYSTHDGAPVAFNELGELPERLTLLPRPGPAYVWLNDAWTLDAELDLDIKTKEELRWIAQALLLAAQEIYKHEDQDPTATASEDGWRQYRVALRAWPQHASFPDMDKRPTPPAQTEDADDET